MCHQLVFGLLFSVLLAYVMLFCHKGVVESGMAEATELVWVSNVLVLFVRRHGRSGEGSRMFLWGRYFCRGNPNSWSVTELRCKRKSHLTSPKHALNKQTKKPNTPKANLVRKRKNSGQTDVTPTSSLNPPGAC